MARFSETRLDELLALILFAMVAGGAPALADVRITKSNTPGFKKGDVVPDDTVLDIPAGKSVKVLILPSNVSKAITGPYKGTAKDFQPTITAKPAVQFPEGATLGSPPPRH